MRQITHHVVRGSGRARSLRTTVSATLVVVLGGLLGGSPAHATESAATDVAAGLVGGSAPAVAERSPKPVKPHAQTLRLGTLSAPIGGATSHLKTLRLRKSGTQSFKAYGVTWASGSGTVKVTARVRQDGRWLPWQELDVDESAKRGRRAGASLAWTGRASDGVDVKVTTVSGPNPRDVRVDLIDPGVATGDAAAATVPNPEETIGTTATVTAPTIYRRADWGADESLMTWPPEYAPSLIAVVLHHTATSNDYGPADVPAIIRSIYHYHAVSNGWGDIGYNVLVDRFGRLWEGRTGGLDQPVIGAHAGGFNTGTAGIAMIGHHSAAPVPSEVIRSAAKYVAWRFAPYGYDPRGTTTITGGPSNKYPANTTLTVPRVFPHRQTSATECPGDQGMAALQPIRDLAYGVEMYAVFNEPTDEAIRDYAIEREIITLADAVPPGSYIRAVMYSWTSQPVAEALKRAAERGAVVRVVLDRRGGGVNSDPTNQAIQILRSAPLDDLVWCGTTAGTVTGSTACIGNHGTSINHNKFFTFSTSGDRKRVVLVTSQNMTYTQNNWFNNAVVISGDYELYDHYVRYFNDLRAQQKNNDYYSSANGYYKSPTTAITSYHSPRADGDTARNVLTYVPDDEPGCAVEVAQLMFTDTRLTVAEELLRIARLGCQVRVVYTEMGVQVRATLLSSSNVELKKYDDNEASNYNGRRVLVHSKYLIVTGNYNGTSGRSIVFTGSPNLSGPGLRSNDETFLKIEDRDVSASFRANFETLWARAKCVNPPNGSCIY